MKQNIKYSPTLEVRDSSFSFDHVHINWNNQIALHQQDTWELSYVITGRGTRVIGDVMESFTKGEVILIPPYISHCWSFDEFIFDGEGKIENISITFSDEFLKSCGSVFIELTEIVDRIRNNRNAISFSGNTLSELQCIMMSMIQEMPFERMLSLIKLLKLIAFPDSTDIVGHLVIEDKKMKKIQGVYLYVMNNYHHNITLGEISEFAGMERTSFCVFFKKMTNESFFTFLTTYRIESSCQMLLKTTKSIAEICYASGFRDVPYYNRIFKKLKNMTPSEYRRAKFDF